MAMETPMVPRTQELIVQQEFAPAGDGALPHHLQHRGGGDHPPRLADLGGRESGSESGQSTDVYSNVYIENCMCIYIYISVAILAQGFGSGAQRPSIEP